MSDDSGFPRETLPTVIAGLSHEVPPWEAFSPDARSSAILLLLIPPPHETPPFAHIVLMRRSIFVRSHRHQIALPGGRRERVDATPWDTAIRETEEELGVPRHRITLLGCLPALSALDGSQVVPVVGFATVSIGEMHPAPLEVSQIFSYPWRDFTRAQSTLFDFKLLGVARKSRVYRQDGQLIWGLTAQVLYAADLK